MTAHALTTLSSSTATLISPNGTHSGLDITVQNVDAAAYVYIGGSGVTAVNYGYRMAPGTAFSIELPGKESLYAITDVNGSKVALLTTNLESGS